jgi:hypothetical protein
MTVPMTFAVAATRDPALYTRDHARFLRAAFWGAAEFHHERHIPRHFEPFASVKYRYLPRSRSYNKVKERLFGTTQPLVLSGTTRDTVTRMKTIRATPKGASLKMDLPIKGGSGRFLTAEAAERLARAGKRSTRTITRKAVDSALRVRQIITEIEAISSDELVRLAQEVRDRYVAGANDLKAQGGGRKRIVIQ